MSVNRALLMGNLGRDPEFRLTASGKQCCTFSLATSDFWIDADGQKQEQTTWHNVVAWGKQAEVIYRYLNKGSRVFIEGRIANRTYDDSEGNRRYISEIVVQSIEFVGGPPAPDNDRSRDEQRRRPVDPGIRRANAAPDSRREGPRSQSPGRRGQADLPL